MNERCFNFSAGPANLPLPALQEAQRDMLSYKDTGASVMELSHRSKAFMEIAETAENNLAKLLGAGDDYKVLILHGGARQQFTNIPKNFMAGQKAEYIVSGTWGEGAFQEAQKEGNANLAWSGKADNYIRVPKDSELKLDPKAAYVHYTSNETIQGVQFRDEPKTDAPLICDASSDILSRPIDIKKYALIYAGAQKNLANAGGALVVLRKDLLDRVPPGLASMLNYKVHAENDSMFNTPPCWVIYMISLTTKWLLETVGGVEKMAAINERKAKLLYDTIDASGGFYEGHAQPEYRSRMNVAFRLKDATLDGEFIKLAEKQNLRELKGHRSVGGMRASIYNAMPEEGVKALADFMKEFQKSKG